MKKINLTSKGLICIVGAIAAVAVLLFSATSLAISPQDAFAANYNYHHKSASSSITLKLTASSVQVGNTMQASGALKSTTGIADVVVDLKVTLPDGASVNPVQGATITTNSAGTFSMSYVPSAIGTYTFTAAFPGNSAYTASSTASIFTVVADPAPPTTPPVNTTAPFSTTPSSYNYKVVVDGSSYAVETRSGSVVYTASTADAAINWAMSSLDGSTGIVYLPTGTYDIANNVEVASNSELVGDGPNSTIITASSPYMIQLQDDSNAAVIGMELTSNVAIGAWAYADTTQTNCRVRVHHRGRHQLVVQLRLHNDQPRRIGVQRRDVRSLHSDGRQHVRLHRGRCR